jgi:hypothetical protein
MHQLTDESYDATMWGEHTDGQGEEGDGAIGGYRGTSR